MKKIIQVLCILIIGVLVVGCATYTGQRDANRKNIQNIRLGNSQAAVVAIMGEATSSGMGGTMTNPYKRESIQVGDTEYVIWYYYTEQIGNKSWEEGMTPVVFANDKVVAIGWRALERLGIDSGSTVTIKRR